jgi:hypothetical protein
VPLGEATLTGDEVIDTPVGSIELQDSYFGDDASRRLFDESDFQRATQAFLWSVPLAGFAAWRDNQTASFDATDPGDFVVLETLREKRGIVTANLTTPYVFNFSDLSQGPIRIEYPAGQTTGAVLDAWQRPVFDMGLTGPDGGEGGSYIVVGPGDDPADYRADGVNVFQSETNNVMIGLRIIDPDPAYFDTFTGAFRMGPAGGEVTTSSFITGKDVEWSGTPPRGIDY